MQIVSINTLYEPHVGGGAEITLRSIVRGLSDRGHTCRVITTAALGEGGSDCVDGVPVTRIPVKNVYWHYSDERQPAVQRMLWHWNDQWNVGMLSVVEGILSTQRPDLVFMHNLTGFSSAVWQVCGRLQIPVVQVLHDYYSICPRSTMFSRGRRCHSQCLVCKFLRRKHPAASNALSGVIGVSDAVLRQHLRHGYFRDVPVKRVIHNARAIPQPNPEKSLGQSIRFGFIGTLAPPKGLDLLLQAFERLCRRMDHDIELLVAGTGKADYVAMLKAKHTNPRIRFLGRMDPESFFSMVDVSMVPSIWDDPFPGVVFESLGFGVPVIANALGGIPEMVQDGVNGVLLAPDRSGQALEDAMFDLAKNPTKIDTLASHARASVAHLLNPKRQIDEYEALMTEVLASHG
jgi:glycosyltransferase involved in cell wall biosynthesis